MSIRKCADQQEFPIHRHIYELAFLIIYRSVNLKRRRSRPSV